MEEPPDYDDVLPKEERDNVLVFRNGANEPIAVPTDVVTEAERAYRCHMSRLGGKSWDIIAMEEKYPSGSAAKADVDRYMAEARSLVTERSQQEMLQLEVMRLDALQAAVWPQAMSGHVPSAAFALNVIVTRLKALGHDPEKLNGDQVQRTVVVPQDDDGFLKSLQDADARASGGH